MQTVVRDPSLRESGELVIPAVPGEFYNYSSKFTEERPLYVFMKCKANKDRIIASAAELGSECNLVFLFGSLARVCSIKMAHAFGVLGDSVNSESFGETWVAATEVAVGDFYSLRSQKDVEVLVEVCRTACSKRGSSIALKRGLVVAVMTDAGKYGMFLVKELTQTSVEIDACHILL